MENLDKSNLFPEQFRGGQSDIDALTVIHNILPIGRKVTVRDYDEYGDCRGKDFTITEYTTDLNIIAYYLDNNDELGLFINDDFEG